MPLPSAILRRSPHRRRGAALVLALIISVLLTIIVIEFVYTTSIDLRQAKRYRDDGQVEYAVNSGLMLAEILMRTDKMRGREVPIDTLDDVWATGEYPTNIGAMSIRVSITDESSKLNLLNLIYPNRKWREEWREAFINLCELIRDHADGENYDLIADDIAQYMSSVKGYDSDNEESPWDGPPLLSLDELATIESVTNGFLYGDADPDEPEVARTPGMWDYLTIHSHGRINLNTASQELIESMHDSITRTLATEITSRRSQEDEATERRQYYRSKDDLRGIEGIEEPLDTDAAPPGEGQPPAQTIYGFLSNKVTTRTSFFSVLVEVTAGEDVQRTFRAYYKRFNVELFRLSLEEIAPDRIPLAGGVALETFDPMGGR